MIGERLPAGFVWIVDPSANDAVTAELPLYDLNPLFHGVGLDDRHFIDWQLRYGVDSLGRAPSGELLIPDFPMFSKISGMHIDPVSLDAAEIGQLIDECDRGMITATGTLAAEYLSAIRAFAEQARTVGCHLRFGHP